MYSVIWLSLQNEYSFSSDDPVSRSFVCHVVIMVISLSIFSNKIISYGSGNTFLYYSNMIPDIDNRPLNFSSLYRLKLNNKLSYPLFNQINYLKGDQLRVSNGEIKVITP